MNRLMERYQNDVVKSMMDKFNYSSIMQAPKLEKIVMVSCNPHSFVNDANVLINGGFVLQKAVMVDQFVYSNHTEMVALFTKK